MLEKNLTELNRQAKEVINEFRDTFTDLPRTTNLGCHHVRLTPE